MSTEAPCCALHPDDEAHRTCERCGAFMCRECSARWVEERCPRCRPKYGPAELTERRMNRVRRHEYLRCDVCGLQSPRLDRVLMPTAGKIIMSIFSLGILSVLAILNPVDTVPMCPGCERTDELEPALQPVPKPKGFVQTSGEKGYDEAFAEQKKLRTRSLVLGLIGPILALALLILYSAG